MRLIFLLSVIFVNMVNAAEKIAFIDNTDESRIFLEEKANYLIENHIPVMLVSDSDTNEKISIEKITKKHQGLLIGNSPPPNDFLSLLLEQLNVRKIPALVSLQKKPGGG